MRKFLRKYWVAAAFLAASLTCGLMGAALTSAAAAPRESAPHCVTGTLAENSGNGPVYHRLSFCSFTDRTNYIVVDGSPLQNGAVLFGSHVAHP